MCKLIIPFESHDPQLSHYIIDVPTRLHLSLLNDSKILLQVAEVTKTHLMDSMLNTSLIYMYK